MQFQSGSELADEMRRDVPSEKKPDVSGYTNDVVCQHCNQGFQVEVVVVIGWKEKESVNCPHCGHKDAFAEMCFSLQAHK